MAKSGIKSGAPERWPVIEILAPLGWTIRQIAAVIGCSEATVAKDLQAKGGMKALWPDRPRKPAEVYAATFRYYVHHMDELGWSVSTHIRQRLNMDLFKTTEKTALTTFGFLVQPVHWRYLYYSLLKTIDPSMFREGWQHPKLLEEYLEAVRAGDEPVPGGPGTVIHCLYQRLTQLDRTHLRSSNVEEFERLLGCILKHLDNYGRDGEPLLTEREAAVLKMHYGLEGDPSKTLSETARTFGMARSRIQMIQAKAIRKLQWARDNKGLLDSFATMESLRTQRDQAHEELVRLSAAHKALQRSHHRICSVVLGGDPAAAQAVVQRELEQQDLGNPNLFRRWDELKLTVRTANVLQNSGIEFIWQVCVMTKTELRKLKGFGRKGANELESILAELDLRLGMDKVKVELQAARYG